MLIYRDLTSGRAVRVNNKNEDVIHRLEEMGWTRQPDVPADVNIATVETVEQLEQFGTGAPAVTAPKPAKKDATDKKAAAKK